MNPVITTAKSFKKVLSYNFQKVDKGVGGVLYSQKISPNSYEEAVWSIRHYEEMEARAKNRVFSVSINPHPDDKISDELFIKIAKDYMEEMGYGEQPYIVFKHWDIERHHIHIIAPRIDWLGKKINDSWEQERSRRCADKLEKKYSLKVTNNYITLDETQKKPLKPVSPKSVDMKEQMAEVVLQLLPKIYFQSLGELNCLLEKYNITAAPTKTEHNGKFYDGVVYIAIDNKGNKVGPPIKGSELGRGAGIYAIKNRIKKSKLFIDEKIPRLREAIDSALEQNPATVQDFQELLLLQGLSIVLRRNEKGRIYGATYVDYENGVAVNGSRLGKAYSANELNRMFEPTGQQLPPPPQNIQAQQGQLLPLEEILPSETHYHSGSNADANAERRFQDRLRREEKERHWQYKKRRRH